MTRKFFQHHLLTAIATIVVVLCCVGGCRAQQATDITWSKALYVSPSGSDKNAGTKDKPFATVEKALSILGDLGGTVALLGGTYKEQVTVGASENAKGEAGLLIITAAPGEDVVFEGGEKITTWTSYNNEDGMYVVEAADRESMHSRTGYLDVWENSTRVRYRKQFDVAGVRAYPGSVCLLDSKHILVHTRDGLDPQANNLWRNRAASGGIRISRDNVVVRGIHFQNYLGGTAARAITIGSASSTDYKGIVIADCSITNCVRGLSITADAPQILNCDIREVGLGMVSYGKNMDVKNCVIQSATGLFAISALNQHERDGIRYYGRARGGTITGNVTAGFWTGFYCKSRTSTDDALPMLIANNIFIDGIRAGSSGPQPKNRYLCNIIGPNQQGVDPMKDRLLQTAIFESNYFFNGGGSAKGSNKAGVNPFVDLAGGDLSIKSDITLPPCSDTTLNSSKATQVKWSSRLVATLQRSLISQALTVKKLKFTQPLIAVSSQQGALISVRLSVPAQSTLRYRKVGETVWQTMKGIDNTLSQPDVIMGAAPVEQDARDADYGTLFSLLNGQLTANTDYEFYIEVVTKGSQPLRSATQKFRTSGGPKVLLVRAGSNAKLADGTPEHPFAELQAAFDHALPGDTIQVAKGVYTEPALLVHGGTAQAPIIIEGAGAELTILDGGKEPPMLLELRQTGNIIIRDIQMRWFGNAGISAIDTEHITVQRCQFFNAGMRGSATPNGMGIYLTNSPHWTISHCIFAKMERGVLAVRSPQLKLLYNTAYQNMYDGVALIFSAEGSQMVGNSFTFTGNDSITISVPSLQVLASMKCDYNNYGTLIRASDKVRPKNDFEPADRYGYIGGSKAIVRCDIDGKMHRFNRLDKWREFSGLDAHSIFADPLYVDPLKVDFRLMPNSPNILPDGKIIGAAPVAKTK